MDTDTTDPAATVVRAILEILAKARGGAPLSELDRAVLAGAKPIFAELRKLCNELLAASEPEKTPASKGKKK